MKNSKIKTSNMYKTYRDVELGDTLYAIHVDKLHYSVKTYELKVVSKLNVSTFDNPTKQDTCVIVCDPFIAVRFKTKDNPVSDLIYTYPDSTQGIVILYADKELANQRLIQESKNIQTLVWNMYSTAYDSTEKYKHILDQFPDNIRMSLF